MPTLIDAARFLSTYVHIVRDPHDLRRVLRLLDHAAEVDPEHFEEFLADPRIQAFLADEPPALDVDLGQLRRMPAGSLGRSFARFLDARGLTVEPLRERSLAASTPGERLRVHLERSHDLWHVVTGFDTDVCGELGLQAFYSAQLPGAPPVAIISAGLLNGIIRDPADLSRRLAAISLGWRYGQAVAPLLGRDWATMLDRPLDEVRAELGVTQTWLTELEALTPDQAHAQVA